MVHAGGRPLERKHDKEVTPVNDGEKREFTLNEVEYGNFPSEKAIEKYFHKHINAFMWSIFGEEVSSSTTQKSPRNGYFKITDTQLIPKRGSRLDIFVECNSGNKYILELKNNTQSNEGIKAISQLLLYNILFPEANKLVIVLTRYDMFLMEIIEKFRLPIEVVLIAKGKTYLVTKSRQNQNG